MTAAGADWSRRSVLAGSAAALLACAACSSNSGGSAPTTPSADAGTGAAAGGSAKSLAKVSAIPAGSGLVVVGASGPVLLANSGDGTVVAHTAVCTHQGATINGTGICPLHGSKFDVKTGAVLTGPATAPLAAVPVKVSGGEVFPG